jgi:hypothetical protein
MAVWMAFGWRWWWWWWCGLRPWQLATSNTPRALKAKSQNALHATCQNPAPPPPPVMACPGRRKCPVSLLATWPCLCLLFAPFHRRNTNTPVGRCRWRAAAGGPPSTAGRYGGARTKDLRPCSWGLGLGVSSLQSRQAHIPDPGYRLSSSPPPPRSHDMPPMIQTPHTPRACHTQGPLGL